ncbi:MAG: CBS domain-containing protein [Geminicoccaceae bacterium]
MQIDTILATKGREVATIAPDRTITEAMQRMRTERVGCLVVTGGSGEIIGIVSDRGLLWNIVDHGVAVVDNPVRNVMSRSVITCAPQEPVAHIMALMTERRIRHIPVVDDTGRLCGIVSIGDVVKHHLDAMEQEAEALKDYVAGKA